MVGEEAGGGVGLKYSGECDNLGEKGLFGPWLAFLTGQELSLGGAGGGGYGEKGRELRGTWGAY